MNKKAYSFIELLIVVAIFSVISGSVYLLLEKGRYVNTGLGVKADLLASAREGMHQIVTDLVETNRYALTKELFVDPLNSQTHQILILACGRGDSAVASEDGVHSNNDYVHLDSDNKPSWRSVIIYCTYVTSGGLQQLRRYVDYGPVGSLVSYYDQPDRFPLTLSSVSATLINLTRKDGSTLNISRNSGRLVVNYIASEDANDDGILDANENDGNNNMPADNQDGILDRGVDFSIDINSDLLRVKLFLTKPETPLTQNKRYITITSNGSAVMRNRKELQ